MHDATLIVNDINEDEEPQLDKDRDKETDYAGYTEYDKKRVQYEYYDT